MLFCKRFRYCTLGLWFAVVNCFFCILALLEYTTLNLCILKEIEKNLWLFDQLTSKLSLFYILVDNILGVSPWSAQLEILCSMVVCSGMSMKIELDTKKQLSSRMYFLKYEDYLINEDVLLTKEVQTCKNYQVYLIVSKFPIHIFYILKIMVQICPKFVWIKLKGQSLPSGGFYIFSVFFLRYLCTPKRLKNIFSFPFWLMEVLKY